MILRREPRDRRNRQRESADDVVRVASFRLAGSSTAEVCTAVSDGLAAELRGYADRHGYLIVGNLQGSARFSDGFIVLESQAVLRPRQDGVWGSIRAALAEDADDRQVLAEAKAHGLEQATVYEIGDVRYHFDTDRQEWVDR